MKMFRMISSGHIFALLCSRHNSIRRQMNLSNPDFNPAQFQRQESLSGLGRIKPELYKQRSVDAEEARCTDYCGRLSFILKFDFDIEQLIVKIHKAENLPAKDFSGTSDPYVKIYLLPDRKTKHQTKVHRKTLNPVFDEVFLFPVAYAELSNRKLHFSVYDFDRFSRHDLIGQVVVDNFLDLADFPQETKLCRDIQYVTSVRYQFFSFILIHNAITFLGIRHSTSVLWHQTDQFQHVCTWKHLMLSCISTIHILLLFQSGHNLPEP